MAQGNLKTSYMSLTQIKQTNKQKQKKQQSEINIVLTENWTGDKSIHCLTHSDPPLIQLD